MRIVSGSRGGRRLKPPPDRAIRPTPDRVREALFAILGSRVPGARFLDLFAGTGANGLEALSRGAREACFVEASKSAVALIRENIGRLEFDAQCTVVTGVLPAALARLARTSPYEIVFADPPYESELLARLLASPHLPPLLVPGGTLVMEAGRHAEVAGAGWSVDSIRDYGDTRLFFLSPQVGEEGP
jgi:16S rRNA (guanine(966)-N(2))-methyltransferase RsmD